MAESSEPHYEKVIRAYYAGVDLTNRDSNDIAAHFAEDCVIDWPGKPVRTGRQVIVDQYGGKGKFVRCEHALANLLIEGRKGAAHGLFTGVTAEGEETVFGFSEFFEFDDDALIRRKSTYLRPPE